MPKGSCVICGHGIFVQIQKNSGYCSGDCAYVGRKADALHQANVALDFARQHGADAQVAAAEAARDRAVEKYREGLRRIKDRLPQNAVVGRV